MACFGCTHWGNPRFAALSKAAAKSAAARLRRTGVLRVFAGWERRTTVCAGCPLRTIIGNASYCGRPFLRQVTRRPTDGCGCPVADKAKAADEHCPLNADGRASRRDGAACDCRWCAAEAIEVRSAAVRVR